MSQTKAKKRARGKYLLIAAATLGVGGVVSGAAYVTSESLSFKGIEMSGIYVDEKPNVADNHLVDMGVTDVNGDGSQEIFTTNHNRQQSLLSYRDGAWDDLYAKMPGLAQDPRFPGLEAKSGPPNTDGPGLSIAWRGALLHVVWQPTPGSRHLEGTVSLPSRIKVEKSDGTTVRVERTGDDPWSRSTMQFSFRDRGQLILNPSFIAVPIDFDVSPLPAKYIFVGHRRINPDGSKFTFRLGDRHGFAWRHINDDPWMDAFITRGGLKGKMSHFTMDFADDLLLSQSEHYVNIIDSSGIDKGTCPGYQTAWTDYNSDQQPDLYVSCQRGHANRLYRADGENKFTSVARELGVALQDNPFHSPFLWLDFDNDGQVELLAQREGEITIWSRAANGERFSPETIHAGVPNFVKFSVSDFDRDGYFDVYASSPFGSLLLENDSGKLSAIDPEAFGLPKTAFSGNWVDFDNDGLTDFYSVAKGIYRQETSGRFSATGLLAHDSSWSLRAARSTWFDANHDGMPDLLLAATYDHPLAQVLWEKLLGKHTPHWKRSPTQWDTRLFRRAGVNDNNWLQILLRGADDNRDAYNARVMVETSAGVQHGVVGQSEGSHYSQGHYLLYFGLGRFETAKVTVQWPDGTRTELSDVPANQRLRVSQDR